MQGNESLPQSNLNTHYHEGVLFVTYSLLIQKGKQGAVIGIYGLDGEVEAAPEEDQQDDVADALGAFP